MRLSQIVCDIDVDVPQDIEISGISYDSRTTKPGDVFVALGDYPVDCHPYIADAVAKGAAAVVCERDMRAGVPTVFVPNTRAALPHISEAFYRYPARALTLIGVTGTKGKTSTTQMTRAILEHSGIRCGLIGSVHNIIGGVAHEAINSTPEAPALSEMFRRMADAGDTHCVMEVSSHALALHRVGALHYVVAGYTNLTLDHLDFHETMEAYGAAKAQLFGMCDYGVLNADDAYAHEILKTCDCAYTLYGIDHGDIRAENIMYDVDKVRFSVDGHDVCLRTPARFSVYNALCAMGIGLQLGLELEQCIAGVEALHGVTGRFEPVPTGRGFSIYIDHAHTPDSLRNILTAAREITKGRLICVFGCGGDRDRTKRPIMGRIASELADLAVVTSDNPRTEHPDDIIREILAGIPDGATNFVAIPSRPDAIAHAIRVANDGDCIILAGKGHETYQIIGHTKTHMDEREIVRDILNS